MKRRFVDDAIFRDDILDEANNIAEFVSGMDRERFLKDTLARRAVERSLTIIGEAAKNMSEKFKKEHPEIEWRKIVGLRNLLSHAYSSINADALWEVAIKDVPALQKKLVEIDI